MIMDIIGEEDCHALSTWLRRTTDVKISVIAPFCQRLIFGRMGRCVSHTQGGKGQGRHGFNYFPFPATDGMV
jgi:hypothetical protein